MISLISTGNVTAEQIVELDADEAHHLHVRRAAPGDHLGLRDGAGLMANAVLLEVKPRKALVRVIDAARAEPPLDLVLLVGAGDRDRFGWLAEKAAELAVTAIVPVETERTLGVATGLKPAQLAKLQRRAVEAIKQSGAAWAPAIDIPIAFDEALSRATDSERLLADAAAEWPTGVVVSRPVAVLVGPEGGFSAAEQAAALGAGWRSVRFGKTILRFETAALVAAAYVGLMRGAAGE